MTSDSTVISAKAPHVGATSVSTVTKGAIV
jgi:hypothetical protein